MDGKRNLSAEVALRFAGALGLTGSASDFFCELVRYNQARSVSERSQAYDRLLRLRPEREARELEAHQAAYHAAWYMPAIRELAARADFSDDPAWIARTLTPSISVAKAKKALKTLESLGLLARTPEGALKPVHALVTTGLTPQSHQIVEYHREMLERASDALELFTRDEREIASLTLCIDEAVLPALKLRLQAFRRELMQYAEGSGEPERVVQVNFQFFPLSKGKDRT